MHLSMYIRELVFFTIVSYFLLESARRDDLESIGYVLILFYTGTLPWVAKYKNLDKPVRRKKYYKEKKSLSINSLCLSLPSIFFLLLLILYR